MASPPLTCAMSSREGPRPRNTRPWPPTDSQVTGEAGDAERSGTKGL